MNLRLLVHCFCQSKRGPFDHRNGSHVIIENGATLPKGME
jgi:hypothetical protein